MNSKIFEQRGKVALLAGLNWSTLLKSAKQRPAEIRAFAQESEAARVVVVSNAARAAVGLYAASDSDMDEAEDGVTKPIKVKIMHSLAAVFAAKVGDGNAVLVLSLPVTGTLSQAVVVVVDSGVPLLDQVKSTEEAQSLAMSYAGGNMGMTYALFTNDIDSFPSGEPIDVEELWALCSKSTTLVPRPVNFVALLAVILVVIGIAGGAYAFFEYKKAEARKELLRKAAAADPTPQYQAALAAQINMLGMNRDAVQALLARMAAQPLWVEGWTVSKVDCNLQLGNCVTTYDRAGGTTDRLIAARKPFGEEVVGDSTSSVVRMEYKVEMPSVGVADRSLLPSLEESTAASTPVLQTWENATVNTTVGGEGYKVWPAVSGIDLNSVGKEVTVKARPVSIRSTPILISEVVNTAPSNFWWSSITFDVKVGSSAVDSLSAELKGTSYVR